MKKRTKHDTYKPGHNSYGDYADSKHPLNCLAWRMKFLRHRCQAKYRQEEYDLKYEDYLDVWFDSGKFTRARRNKNCYQMKRIDASKAWHRDNVYITKNHWLQMLKPGSEIHHLKYTVTGYSEQDTVKK